MKTRIDPSITAGYILGPDYCEIKPPGGCSYAFTRMHPVRGPDGKYPVESEWCQQFQSRMRSLIRGAGFPVASTQELPAELQSIIETQLVSRVALNEAEAQRLAQPNVRINLTLPKGHPGRSVPVEEPAATGELDALRDQINQLEEFLDDPGDVVEQLGRAKYDALYAELQELYAKRAALVSQSAST